MNVLSAPIQIIKRLLEDIGVEETAQQIADQCYDNLASPLEQTRLDLRGNQLRGYLRARSAVEIRRQIGDLVSQGRSLPEEMQRELYQFSADRLVKSLIRQIPVSVTPSHSPRQAA
jgi:hypothetical protein